DPEYQAMLTARCSFSLFQGTEGNDLWAQQGGVKDSLYIYATDGTLADYLAPTGEISTNMSTEEGYANVKSAILAVLQG
ncbi:MAG: AhpC-related (seleno)protein, partial [Nannocystaceae bacterium]